MDAYLSSTALAKLQQAAQNKQPLRLAFLDIDNTWTGSSTDQQTLRTLLESQGYTIAVTTNRTSEMSMSWSERQKSSSQVRHRPAAKFAFPDPSSLQTVDPAQVPQLIGFLDPDIMVTTLGTELFLKQNQGGYQADVSYLKRLPSSPKSWYTKIHRLLEEYAKQGIEFTLYHPVDIAPTDLRLMVLPKDRTQQDKLISALSATADPPLHVTHDSLNVIITPAETSKENAADHVVNHLTKLLALTPHNLRLLFAGDSMADASTGFFSGFRADATFVIPGGATLTRELESGKLMAMRQQLTKTKDGDILPTGVYWFSEGNRTIVIGDEAFPGTVGPQTLIAWLRENP